MENAYAQALWRAIQKGMAPTAAVHAMHKRLKEEGREALTPRIAKAFARIAAHDDEKSAVVLAVADLSHKDSALREAAAAGLDLKAARTSVDHTLIGGWRLESAESLVDASYKKHLLAIYRGATRS